MVESRSKQLLLAVDGSPHSYAAIDLVASLDWPAGTAVHVLAVAPEPWSPPDLNAEAGVVESVATRIRKRNQAAAERVATYVANCLRRANADLHRDDLAITAEVREGCAAEMILDQARTLHADLIAIGASGLSGPGEFRLGGTARRVVERACCSVLVARPPADAPLHRLVLAVDGSPEAQRAVEWVRALTLQRGSEVAVISVAEIIGDFSYGLTSETEYPHGADLALMQRAQLHTAETHVWAALDRLQISGGYIQPSVRAGHPAAEIIRSAQAHDADLLVVGARGQTRVESFALGNVAEKLIRFAPCSVLVVR